MPQAQHKKKGLAGAQRSGPVVSAYHPTGNASRTPREQAAWEKAHDVWGDPGVWAHPLQRYVPAWAKTTDFTDPSGGHGFLGTGSGAAAGDALMLRNLIPSVGSNIADTVRGLGAAAAHPRRTASGLGDIAMGSFENALTNAGFPNRTHLTPEQKAEADRWSRAADAAHDTLLAPYTTSGAFDEKKAAYTAATDPGRVLSDASAVLAPGGELVKGLGAATRVASDAAKAAQAARLSASLRRVSDVAKAAGSGAVDTATAINPLTGALKAAGAVRRGANRVPGVNKIPVVSEAPLIPTKVPPMLRRYARRGAQSAARDPNATIGATGKNAAQLMDDARKPSGIGDIAATIKQAVGEYRQNSIAKTMQSKAALGRGPVDMTPAYDAYQQAEADAIRRAGGDASLLDPEVADALGRTQARLLHLSVNTAHDPLMVDAARQGMWESARGASSDTAQRVYDTVARGLRDSLTAHDPAYGDILKSSEAGMQAVQDMGTAAGSTSRSSAAAVAKALRSVKTPGGANLIETLANETKSGEALPYQLAGAMSAQNVNPHLLTGAFGLLPAAAEAYEFMANMGKNPGSALAAAVPAGIAAVVSSPKLVIGAERLAGNFAGKAQRVADMISPDVRDAAAEAARVARPAALDAAARSQNTPQSATPPEPAKLPPPIPTDAAANYDVGPPTQSPAPPDHATDDEFEVDPAPNVAPPPTPIPAAATATPAQPDQGDDIEVDPSATPQGFASGGKVADPDVERLVGRLMRKATHAKKASDAATEPLLKQPDEAITKALAIAQEAI